MNQSVMINLTTFLSMQEKKVQIPFSSEFYFDIFEHGSVGNTSEIRYSKWKLSLIQSKYIADHPDCSIPGGDEGIRRYIFKPLRKGRTKIIIKELFRGELKNKMKIKIEVTE